MMGPSFELSLFVIILVMLIGLLMVSLLAGRHVR